MSWFVRIFFGVIILCAILYAIDWLKNQLQKKQTAKAVVARRKKETYPVMRGLARKEESEYELTFRLPERQDEEVVLTVTEKVFDSLPRGTEGILVWKGRSLCDFTVLRYPEADASDYDSSKGRG